MFLGYFAYELWELLLWSASHNLLLTFYFQQYHRPSSSFLSSKAVCPSLILGGGVVCSLFHEAQWKWQRAPWMECQSIAGHTRTHFAHHEPRLTWLHGFGLPGGNHVRSTRLPYCWINFPSDFKNKPKARFNWKKKCCPLLINTNKIYISVIKYNVGFYSCPLKWSINLSLRCLKVVDNSSDGLDVGVLGVPLAKITVIPPLHDVHSASVVGLLIQYPSVQAGGKMQTIMHKWLPLVDKWKISQWEVSRLTAS